MLSDESSSDSETGRFKSQQKGNEEKSKHYENSSTVRSRRDRPPVHDRYHREFERKRDERGPYESRSRDRPRFSRHSPGRRQYSRDRSPSRRSYERERYRHSDSGRTKSSTHQSQSDSRERRRSRSRKTQEPGSDLKDEIKHHLKEVKHSEKVDKKTTHSREKSPPSDHKSNRSEIHKPPSTEPVKKKSESPILIEEKESSDPSEEVQPSSYYSMIPAVVKEKSDLSSEIDSSDDEKLRAKLLNLKKELQKTKKKKHKKKHKKKSAKSSKDKDRESSTVEVSSTTDIDKADVSVIQNEPTEVTSTQKSNQKESSEEGEISSDDDSQENVDIDSNDLRHKIKRVTQKLGSSNEIRKEDICGPALPPHLQRKFRRSTSQDAEGPALPPHLQKQPKNIGPSIPDDLRKELAEREVVKFESSDEDLGIGPLPSGAEDKWSDAHKKLEERALDMKIRNLDGHSLQKSDVKSREQWMLELPAAKAKILGLEGRKFRAKEGPDMSDRSSWTDTPEEKSRKAAGIVKEEDPDVVLQREAHARHVANRDEEQESAVKKHKKKHKREESLLEMHQKKLKKKKKKDEKDDEKKERRPFSRDVDLQVNKFDEAQKKSIIKKAQNLDSRFSSGQAKYL